TCGLITRAAGFGPLCEVSAAIKSAASAIAIAPAPARRRRNVCGARPRPQPPPDEAVASSSAAGSSSTAGVRVFWERSSHVQSQRVIRLYFDYVIPFWLSIGLLS